MDFIKATVTMTLPPPFKYSGIFGKCSTSINFYLEYGDESAQRAIRDSRVKGGGNVTILLALLMILNQFLDCVMTILYRRGVCTKYACKDQEAGVKILHTLLHEYDVTYVVMTALRVGRGKKPKDTACVLFACSLNKPAGKI